MKCPFNKIDKFNFVFLHLLSKMEAFMQQHLFAACV